MLTTLLLQAMEGRISVCFVPNKNINPFGQLLPTIAIASMWKTATQAVCVIVQTARTCFGLAAQVVCAADTCCREDSGAHPTADFVCGLWH